VLTWTVPAGVDPKTLTGYRVLRATPHHTLVQYASPHCTSTMCTWTDNHSYRHHTYRYEVIATNSAGSGPASRSVTARIR
jgi:hypothetical protein